jgi:hypothetical protein
MVIVIYSSWPNPDVTHIGIDSSSDWGGPSHNDTETVTRLPYLGENRDGEEEGEVKIIRL